MLYFIFQTFKPYNILCFPKIFLAGYAQSRVPNTSNISHSVTHITHPFSCSTNTHSVLRVLFATSLCSLISHFTRHKNVVSKEFKWLCSIIQLTHFIWLIITLWFSRVNPNSFYCQYYCLIISTYLHSITLVCLHRCSDRMLCDYVEPTGRAVWAIVLQRFPSWDRRYEPR